MGPTTVVRTGPTRTREPSPPPSTVRDGTRRERRRASSFTPTCVGGTRPSVRPSCLGSAGLSSPTRPHGTHSSPGPVSPSRSSPVRRRGPGPVGGCAGVTRTGAPVPRPPTRRRAGSVTPRRGAATGRHTGGCVTPNTGRSGRRPWSGVHFQPDTPLVTPCTPSPSGAGASPVGAGLTARPSSTRPPSPPTSATDDTGRLTSRRGRATASRGHGGAGVGTRRSPSTRETVTTISSSATRATSS